MNISMKQNHRLSGNRLVTARGKGVAKGWIGGLGFTDVTGMYEWITTGSYCTEEKSTSNIL